jgi:hypothetical protein
MRKEVDADAGGTDLRYRLVDIDLRPDLVQTQRGRQSTYPCADHDYSVGGSAHSKDLVDFNRY